MMHFSIFDAKNTPQNDLSNVSIWLGLAWGTRLSAINEFMYQRRRGRHVHCGIMSRSMFLSGERMRKKCLVTIPAYVLISLI